ncbi:MAG TPA: DnaA regulatory inactivator Hda [Woeseiaceae bacterium]|nr:DnaA regulatory inactivator Hda [Woeseiaceae bacterium]
MSQLALPLKLADHAVFESFWPAGNEALVAYLVNLAEHADGPGCWLWGAAASGRSHLLQAACARRGDRAVYLPLGALEGRTPALLEGIALRSFVCLDDIGRVTGHRDWEHALFDLCNQLADGGGTLLVAADAPPRDSGIVLPDLLSRLALLPAFRVRALGEADRIRALQLRARHRGLELPHDTARFLLSRSRRDMASLYALLDRLDAAALQAQRRLTIPFVRSIVDAGRAAGE